MGSPPHQLQRDVQGVSAGAWDSRIIEHSELEETQKRITNSNSWLHIGPPKIKTLCLKALSIGFLTGLVP